MPQQQRIKTGVSGQTPLKAVSRKLSLAQTRALIRKGASKRRINAVSRRQFLGTAAAASATLGLASHLEGRGRGHKDNERRSLFFNLSHEDYKGQTYYFVSGTRRYRLQEADPSHPALLRARQTNNLLQSLPPEAVTHVVENFALPPGVQLGYTMKILDQSQGTWAMSSIQLQVPASGVSDAYARARQNLLEGAPLPLSPKRMKYGLPAAVTLQDVLDESALVDSTDWAKTMVNVHPELLNLEPTSAAHIQNNLIDARSTFQLSQQLELAGPAIPQQSATTDTSNNDTGWATLVPFTDDNGQPIVGTNGNNAGLIVYDTQWQPNIKTFVGAALRPTSTAVKNDPTLGANVTDSSQSSTPSDLNGAIWFRKDGIANVDQSSQTFRSLYSSDNAQFTASNITPNYNGYSVSAKNSGDSVTLTFSNWYLRWLGLYAQFLDGDKPVPLSSIPSGISHYSNLDLQSGYVYLGVLTPEFTFYGIPIASSSYTATFNFPTQVATSAKILASGLGFGSHTYQDTETLGVALTSVFNLAIPALIIVMGASPGIDIWFKQFVFPAATSLATEIFLAIGGTDTQDATSFLRQFARWFLNPNGPLKLLATAFAAFLAAEAITNLLADWMPLVGVILQCLGVAGTIAEIDETSIEVVLSPWTYEYDLVGTHDLSVTLVPSSTPPQNGLFPSSAATYTVKAIFDSGTPVLQTVTMQQNGNDKTLPPVVFQSVPLGGNVTVSVAFYTADNTLVGHGSATAVNSMNANPTITVDAGSAAHYL